MEKQLGSLDMESDFLDPPFILCKITTLTFHSGGKLSCEKYVGQFALYVGLHWMIVFLTVQVLKVDLSHGMNK